MQSKIVILKKVKLHILVAQVEPNLTQHGTETSPKNYSDIYYHLNYILTLLLYSNIWNLV